MACFHPLTAWQSHDGRVVFSEPRDFARSLNLPCGQCIGCRLNRSRMWAIRCMHESRMHSDSSFVTLTYDDEYLSSPSLDYNHFQDFMKRIRYYFTHVSHGRPVRFFACGEYGSLNWRPHFHALLFGITFPDTKYFRTLGSGCKIYTSDVLDRIWPFGYASIGAVSFESAAYVARYICKKVTGDDAELHYKRVDPGTGAVIDLVPEFCHMSLKPGIGSAWFAKFGESDAIHRNGIVLPGGKLVKFPKYYKELLRRDDPFKADDLDWQSCQDAERFVDDCTEARLAVREEVAKAALKFKQRDLE